MARPMNVISLFLQQRITLISSTESDSKETPCSRYSKNILNRAIISPNVFKSIAIYHLFYHFPYFKFVAFDFPTFPVFQQKTNTLKNKLELLYRMENYFISNNFCNKWQSKQLQRLENPNQIDRFRDRSTLFQ